MAQFFILLITFYQKAISPLLPKTCRYEPTCSSYAISAIKKHGALAGLYLGTKRILRCTPWSKHQHFDPVPDEFTWRKKDNGND